VKTKVCKKCKKKKSLSAFRKANWGKNGYDSQCKVCRKLYAKQWRKRNPEEAKKKNRKQKLKINFGMTVDDYDKIFEIQKGVCAICGQPEISKNQYGLRRLSVDHNHVTGKVRGLLCSRCNIGIGHLNVDKKDVTLLLNAIEYIRKNILARGADD